MNTDMEKEAFEAWGRREGVALWPHPDNPGLYYCGAAQKAAEAFQAGAVWQCAQSAPVVPEYTSAMGEAAQKYIDECCRGSDGELLIVPPRMPGSFYWYELFARMLAAAPQPAAQGEFGDAYQGAREDLAVWKRRALEAEEKVRTYDQRIVDLGALGMGTAHEKGQEVRRLREALEGVVKRCSKGHGGSGYVGKDGQYLKVIDAALSSEAEGK